MKFRIYTVLQALIPLWFLLPGLIRPMNGQTDSTSVIELGIEPGIDRSHGLRRQVVDPGVTIHWINGDDPQAMEPVPVTIEGALNPCGGKSQDVLDGVCTISKKLSVAPMQEFFYHYCPNLRNLGCKPSFVPGRFRLRIKDPNDGTKPKVGPDVFIALTSTGQINQIIHTGDTVFWLDDSAKPQNITFKSIKGSKPFNPCQTDTLSGLDQGGPCTIRVPGPQSYAYQCLGDVCADPIVHVIRGGSGGQLQIPSFAIILKLSLAFLILIALGFGVYRVRRKA